MEQELLEARSEAASECTQAANTCWDSGDPVMDDCFQDILQRYADRVQKIVLNRVKEIILEAKTHVVSN